MIVFRVSQKVQDNIFVGLMWRMDFALGLSQSYCRAAILEGGNLNGLCKA